MTLLIAGVLLWSIAHLFPSIMPTTRAAFIERLGRNRYRGVFSIDILIALALIVVGWRSAEVQAVYNPPAYGNPIVPALMLLSFVLFAAASAPGNIKRFLRHPMLAGMLVWGVAHLLANGDNRSIVLFGGMSLWAVLSMLLINRRDGRWEKAAPVSISKDITTVIASAALFALIAWFHSTLFGVAAIAGW